MIIYNDDEIAAARRSNQVVARILDELGAMIKPGLRTRELDGYAEARTRELGAVPAFKGYRGYPATICAGVTRIPFSPRPRRPLAALKPVGMARNFPPPGPSRAPRDTTS